MLAYPYGLCISLKLLGSLCRSLDSEASSRLIEREKALSLTDEGFFPPLAVYSHSQGSFPREASSIDTVTNSFFFLLQPSEAKAFSLCF